MTPHLLLSRLSLVATALLISSVAVAGEYSVFRTAATYTNSGNSGIELVAGDQQSVEIIAKADATNSTASSKATGTFQVVYKPDPGEVNLPSTAYILLNFTNYYEMQNSADTASVLDVADDLTTVHEVDRQDFALFNGASTFFGQEVKTVALSLVNGELVGSFTVSTNTIKASVANTSRTSLASQAASVTAVSSTPLTGVQRQLASDDQLTFKRVSGPTKSLETYNLPGPQWTGYRTSNPRTVGRATFEWDVVVNANSLSPGRAEQPLTNFGFDGMSDSLTYEVIARRATAITSVSVTKTTGFYRSSEATGVLNGTAGYVTVYASGTAVKSFAGNPGFVAFSPKPSTVTNSVSMSSYGNRLYKGNYSYSVSTHSVHISGQPDKTGTTPPGRAELHGTGKYRVKVTLGG